MQCFYFEGKCGNPDRTSVSAALTTATWGAGMSPSEHWGGTISIYWAGTNLHLPTQSASKAKARATTTKKKKAKKNQQTSTIMHYTARWSISAVGAVSRLFPREQSSGKHTNPPLHKLFNVWILNLYKLTLLEVNISNKSKVKYLTVSLKFTF